MFVEDKFLPFGCQWYVDPPRPDRTRFLFNEANADARGLFNGHNTLSASCTARSHWCYPTYSYRVCGGQRDGGDGGGVLPAAAVLLAALCLLWLFSGVCKRLYSCRVGSGPIKPSTKEARGPATEPAKGERPGENHISISDKTNPPILTPLPSLPWRTQNDRLQTALGML